VPSAADGIEEADLFEIPDEDEDEVAAAAAAESSDLDVLPFEEESFEEEEEELALAAAECGDGLITLLHRRVSKILSWERLLSYLCVAGATRFSAAQYRVFAAALRAANQNVRLLSYKSVRRGLRFQLLNACFPKSSELYIRDAPRGPTTRRNEDTVRTQNAGEQHPQDCMRLVLPSEWAKLDVAMYPFYRDVYEARTEDGTRCPSIEKSAMILDRAAAIGLERALWVTYRDAMCRARFGDTISFPCNSRPRHVDRTQWDVGQLGWLVEDDRGRRHGNRGVCIRGVLAGTWCVQGSESVQHFNPAGQEDWPDEEKKVRRLLSHSSLRSLDSVHRSERSDAARAIRPEGEPVLAPRLKMKQARLSKNCSLNAVEVYPGDFCAIVRPERDVERSGVLCVFVASIVRYANGRAAERLVWIDTSKAGDDGRGDLVEIAAATATKMPEWRPGRRQTPTADVDPRTRNVGFLENGERFVVYRIALYADGFKQLKSLSDTRSVGGCYILPLGLPEENRRTSAAARVLTLTPDGQSLNDAMCQIVDDLVQGALQGVEGVDTYGRRVRVFIDTVAFFGDYPAVTATADVMGHTADSFCPLCTVRRRKGNGRSEVLYTSEIHSRRLGYMRFEERIRAIRAARPRRELRKRLGMRCESSEEAEKLSSVKLSESLRLAGRPPRTELGEFVVEGTFDSSLSAAAVPDHLLTGLVKNVLTLSFSELSSDEERAEVELRIVSCMGRNGLPVQGKILRWERSGKCKGLLSLTMSGLLCALLCAAAIFKQLYEKNQNPVFLLAQALQDLVAKVYFWPSKVVDGIEEVNRISGEGHRVYYGQLCSLAREFVEKADAMVTLCGERAMVLDKPNAHRALELCAHTIPNFGHARNCSEMVLEMVHRTFKEWLEVNTHADAHLTAMERALGRDWLGRIHALYMCWTHGNRRERDCAEIGLRRLFLGVEGLEVDETREEGARLLSVFWEAMRQTFRDPVLAQIRDCGAGTLPCEGRYEWDSVFRVRMSGRPADVDRCVRMLTLHYKLKLGVQEYDCDVYQRARYVRVEKFGGYRRAQAHNTVCEGDVVSVVTGREDDETSTIVDSVEDGVGRLDIYVVLRILKGSDDVVWGAVREMKPRSVGMSCAGSPTRLLRFGRGVRRAAMVHVCDDGCEFNRLGNVAKHSKTAAAEGVYEILTRRHGYPPHMG